VTIFLYNEFLLASGERMFVVLTSKPGLYRTEAMEGLVPVGTYQYFEGARLLATFVIAELCCESTIRIVDEAEGGQSNIIRTKFLDRFVSRMEAYRTLMELARHGGSGALLLEQ
jgi:hypothetical protein